MVRHTRVERKDSRIKADVDLLRDLSDEAKRTRRPGQTLQARLYELRLELGQ